MCETVRRFASVLADAGAASSPPVSASLWDERFSSAQAEALLDPYGGGMSSTVEVDSLAASLVLEHYFAEGGMDRAEKVLPGTPSAEILSAIGRRGQEQETDEDLFGEESRRRLYERRADSIRSTGDRDFVPLMRPPKNKRKRRKRR